MDKNIKDTLIILNGAIESILNNQSIHHATSEIDADAMELLSNAADHVEFS